MIQHNKYSDYEKLERLEWKFYNPVKYGNLYIAKLQRPIYMNLPKSEILEIYEEPNTHVKRLKYIIDPKKHNSLITFFDNMDSLCIELATENSVEWFKKQVDKRKLVEYYNKIYNEDDEPDEEGIYNITCELEIKSMDLLNSLMNYNEDELMNIMVCISGIEFYKQTFQWSISIEKVLEEMTIDNINDEESEDELEEELEEESEESEEELYEIEEIKDKSSKEVNENKGGRTNDELINELNEEENISNEIMKKFIISQPESLKNIETKDIKNKDNKKIDTTSRMDIESLISQKSEDIRRYMLNAERARRAADVMHQKAKFLGEELKMYQNQLRRGDF